jgi:preprotein translocase subunit SecB
MKEDTQGKSRQATPQFSLEKVYLKDLSFESPQPIESLKLADKSDVDFQIHSESRKLDGSDIYEAVLTITVTVTVEKKVLYLIEVKQAGLFILRGVQPQDLAALLNINCPSILFPYVREVISSMAERGGFPQLLLKPVNFEAVYRQYLLEKRKQGTAPA